MWQNCWLSDSTLDMDTAKDDASDDADKAGGQHRKRVVGFERPSLLQDIRNILQEYPDDGQIFKVTTAQFSPVLSRPLRKTKNTHARTHARTHAHTHTHTHTHPHTHTHTHRGGVGG